MRNLTGILECNDLPGSKLKWIISGGIFFLMLAIMTEIGPLYLAVGFVALVTLIVSFNVSVRLFILIALLPFSHAGLGIRSFGGFGVFDIFAGWVILLYLIRTSFIDLFIFKMHKVLRFALFIPIFFFPSLINSTDYISSLKSFVQLIVSILTAAVVYDILQRESKENLDIGLLRFFVLEAVGVALYGIYQAYSTSTILSVLSGRIFFSFFEDVNYYAGYLLMTLAIAIGFISMRKNVFHRLIFLIASLVLAGAVIATVSRSGIIVLLLVVFTYSIYFLFQRGVQKLFSVGVLAVFSVVILILVSTDVGGKFLDLFTLSQRVGTVLSGHDPSYEQRQTIFGVGLRMIEDHPFIGVGLGAFESTFDNYKGGDLSTGSARSAHNTVLRIFAETGLVGFVPTACFLVALIGVLAKSMRRAVIHNNKIIIFSIIVSLASFILMSLSLDQFFEPHFWIMCGIGVAIAERIEMKSNAYSPSVGG